MQIKNDQSISSRSFYLVIKVVFAEFLELKLSKQINETHYTREAIS